MDFQIFGTEALADIAFVIAWVNLNKFPVDLVVDIQIYHLEHLMFQLCFRLYIQMYFKISTEALADIAFVIALVNLNKSPVDLVVVIQNIFFQQNLMFQLFFLFFIQMYFKIIR